MSDESKTESPNVPWIQTIRRESGLVEHIDKDGCGHPAIGSVIWMELNGQECMGIHGCNGACHDPAWRLADAIEGLKIANTLLFNLTKEKKKFKEEIKALKEELATLKKANKEMVEVTTRAIQAI